LDYNCAIYCCNYKSIYVMKKINLAITGCLGRMGQHLIKSSKNKKLTKWEEKFKELENSK